MDVSVAIVGHEHRRYLEHALSSVLGSETRRSLEVIFVDNDSRDGSAEFVAGAFPEVRLIRNLRRHGLSFNNNLAFSVSRGRHFFILNPDTQVGKHAIENMSSYLDAHEDVGAVGPKLLFPDGTLQLSCRRFPTLRTFLLRRTPLRLLKFDTQRDTNHLMTDVDHRAASPVDWLLGAAVMVRREAYEGVGGQDERFELYCEDIDLCYRLHEADWQVHYQPQAVVIHDHMAETDKAFLTRRSLLHYRSMLRYVFGHGVKLS